MFKMVERIADESPETGGIQVRCWSRLAYLAGYKGSYNVTPGQIFGSASDENQIIRNRREERIYTECKQKETNTQATDTHR